MSAVQCNGEDAPINNRLSQTDWTHGSHAPRRGHVTQRAPWQQLLLRIDVPFPLIDAADVD
jgi:hypothetical protein